MTERKDTVLVVDAPSDRRAASVMAYARSPHVERILVTSGSGLLDHNCPSLPKGAVKIFPTSHTDSEQILKLAEEERPDLIEVNQEDAIYLGVTDLLRKHRFLVFGVSRAVGRYEWEKPFARREMQKYGSDECLPAFRVFRHPNAGLEYIRKRFAEGYDGQLFIKAAYPASGKGVYAVSNISEAWESFQKLMSLPNRAGRSFLVEDGVGGPKAEEFSGYFVGNSFEELGYYQDHKRVYDNDEGPNTGGMGSVGPISLITSELGSSIRQKIVHPLALSIQNRGLVNNGILYLGGMYDPETGGLWNIEWNTRNGGSESASNMPGLQNDYYEMTRSVAEGSGRPLDIRHDGKIRVAVAGTALGYPDDFKRVIGRRVQGLKEVIKRGEVLVLGAGIDDNFKVAGGRIFWLVAAAETVEQATNVVYRNMEDISIPGDEKGENLLHFRRDISIKELRRCTKKC